MAAMTPTQSTSSQIQAQRKKILTRAGITMFTLLLLSIYLMPLGYGTVTSLKSKSQIADPKAPILPSLARTFEYEGKEYDVYQVPTDNGVQELALFKKGRENSKFVDPASPDAGLIEWEGRWRTLTPARELAVQWSNYPEAFTAIDFLLLLRNTLMYAGITTFAAVVSAAIVGYGFARFDFPFKNVLFIIVIATITLPPQVTLVPKYAFFAYIGWTGTWWPLIVPTFFANAYNIFLMRQYFMTIPRELDDAAMIDGANPMQIFLSINLPQAKPALVAVGLFHFFFAWNDFFDPLIYLAGQPDLYPLTIGLTFFSGQFSQEPQLIQAASFMTLIIPLIIFFLAQRFFIQGVVMTGVDK